MRSERFGFPAAKPGSKGSPRCGKLARDERGESVPGFLPATREMAYFPGAWVPGVGGNWASLLRRTP